MKAQNKVWLLKRTPAGLLQRFLAIYELELPGPQQCELQVYVTDQNGRTRQSVTTGSLEHTRAGLRMMVGEAVLAGYIPVSLDDAPGDPGAARLTCPCCGEKFSIPADHRTPVWCPACELRLA